MRLYIHVSSTNVDLSPQKYQTDGLLGLLWRTWETAPQLSALAKAGWETGWERTSAEAMKNPLKGEGGRGGEGRRGKPLAGSPPAPPSLTDKAVLKDFCAANFGAPTALQCTDLFLQLDSFSPTHVPNTGPGSSTVDTKIPRDGQACCGGPMHVVAVPEEHIAMLNISGLEAWLKVVLSGVLPGGGGATTAAQASRATAWVTHFRYHRETMVVTNAAAVLLAALKNGSVHDAASAESVGLPLARNVVSSYSRMMTLLLECMTTPGTLGMIASHEAANWPSKFNPPVQQLSKWLDKATMASLALPTTYSGAPRLFPSAVRTVVRVYADIESTSYL